jgi:hypothetical protein
MECEQLEIKNILAYQEDINTHYLAEKIAVEQDHILAVIFCKKTPTNCPLADNFKQRTLEHLANKNTKFDTVLSACYRLRVLLAELRELRATYVPSTYAYRIKHEDSNPNSFGKIDHHSKFQFTQQPPQQKVAFNGCCMTNHTTSDCFWEGRPIHNKTQKSWYNSEKGFAFRYAGQTYLRLGGKIPGYSAATLEDMFFRPV